MDQPQWVRSASTEVYSLLRHIQIKVFQLVCFLRALLNCGKDNTSSVINGSYNIKDGSISEFEFSNFIKDGQSTVTVNDGYKNYSLVNTKFSQDGGVINCRVRFYIISNDSTTVSNAIQNRKVPEVKDVNGKDIFSVGDSTIYNSLSTFSVSVDLPKGIDARVIRYCQEVIRLFEVGSLSKRWLWRC